MNEYFTLLSSQEQPTPILRGSKASSLIAVPGVLEALDKLLHVPHIPQIAQVVLPGQSDQAVLSPAQPLYPCHHIHMWLGRLHDLPTLEVDYLNMAVKVTNHGTIGQELNRRDVLLVHLLHTQSLSLLAVVAAHKFIASSNDQIPLCSKLQRSQEHLRVRLPIIESNSGNMFFTNIKDPDLNP